MFQDKLKLELFISTFQTYMVLTTQQTKAQFYVMALTLMDFRAKKKQLLLYF